MAEPNAEIWSLHVAGEPYPQPRPAVMRTGHVYYPDKTGRLKLWVGALRAAFNRTPLMLPPPYVVSLDFVFERPPSHLTKAGSVREAHRAAVPSWDLDNLAKCVLDEMQRHGVLQNDRLVTELHVAKRWGSSPEIGCTIRVR